MPGAPSSYLLLVVRPGAPSSILAPSTGHAIFIKSLSCGKVTRWCSFVNSDSKPSHPNQPSLNIGHLCIRRDPGISCEPTSRRNKGGFQAVALQAENHRKSVDLSSYRRDVHHSFRKYPPPAGHHRSLQVGRSPNVLPLLSGQSDCPARSLAAAGGPRNGASVSKPREPRGRGT